MPDIIAWDLFRHPDCSFDGMPDKVNRPTGGSEPERKQPAGGPADADHEPEDDVNTAEGRSDPATKADQRAKAEGKK
jgi:hypothetical protein